MEYLPKRAKHRAEPEQERCMLQSAKTQGQSHLSPLTSEIEPQDLKFALQGFCLALVQYFLIVLLFLLLVRGLHILCNWMLEVYNLGFIGGYCSAGTHQLRKPHSSLPKPCPLRETRESKPSSTAATQDFCQKAYHSRSPTWGAPTRYLNCSL